MLYPCEECGMIDRWFKRWLCVAGLGPGQYRVSMPPRKKDQEFLLRIDSSSAFGQPEPHLTTLPNPALHVPCAAIASCWAFNDVSCVCPVCVGPTQNIDMAAGNRPQNMTLCCWNLCVFAFQWMS